MNATVWAAGDASGDAPSFSPLSLRSSVPRVTVTASLTSINGAHVTATHNVANAGWSAGWRGGSLGTAPAAATTLSTVAVPHASTSMSSDARSCCGKGFSCGTD